MRFVQPSTDSEWDAYYDLRFRILREPWGQEKGSERDESDVRSYNLMMLDDYDQPCGVARLHYNSEVEGQVRYMAIDSSVQGKGYGSMLLAQLEKVAREHGALQMMLEARETALSFYRSNGYEVTKQSYLLFDSIQHYTMIKNLSAPLAAMKKNDP